MTFRNPTGRDDDPSNRTLPRRQFLAAGAAVGATFLAGCTGGTDEERAGTTFRLLISDQPADIGDFDRLDVTLDAARIFPTDETTTESESGTTTESDPGTTTAEGTETTTDDATGTTTDGTTDAPANERVREEDGFSVLDLDDPTVDLTEVLGDAAMPVFEGRLEPGTYAKVELEVAAVEGIVDGEEVPVKVPSEKLQLTKPFEVGEEPVDFVFDINVVKKGPNGYNLLPVISESGVAGEGIEMTEVPRNASQSG